MPSIYDAIYFLALFLCIAIRLIVCFKRCYHRRRQHRRGRNIDRPTVVSPSNSLQQRHDPEERRELILTSIIIKNAVLPESMDLQESHSKKDIEEGIIADHVDSKLSSSHSDGDKKNCNKDGVENEQKGNILEDGYTTTTMEEEDVTNTDEEQDPNAHASDGRGGTILQMGEETLLQMLTISAGDGTPLFTSWEPLSVTEILNGDNNDSNSVDNYSAESCPICLESYSAGEEICWSRNENCVHSFHLDCMQAWLMKSDDCPLCRENYLNNGPDTS